MALKPCKECKERISTDAKACPRCGALKPTSETLPAGLIGAAVIGAMAVVTMAGMALAPDIPAMPPQAAPEPTISKEDQRRTDGVVRAAGAARTLRQSMRNPASFTLSTALLTDSGAVCLEYRAQSGFGGMNVAQAVAVGDTVHDETMKGFRAPWSKHCEGVSGIDITARILPLL